MAQKLRERIVDLLKRGIAPWRARLVAFLTRLRAPVEATGPPRIRLRTKFILATNLLIFVLVVSGALLVEMRQRSAIISEVNKRTLLLAKSLAEASTNALVTYNYVVLEQTVGQMLREPDVLYALIYDKEGSLAATTLAGEQLDKLLEHPVSRDALILAAPTIRSAELDFISRLPLYDVATPVRLEASPDSWGTIRVGVSLQSMYAEIARTRWQIALFGLVTLILSSLGSRAVAQQITNPLRQLTAGVTAVGRGDLSPSITPSTRDELGQLSQAFNEMIEQLRRIREMEDKVKHAERLSMIGTLAATIAHDIRNPLTALSLALQTVEKTIADPDLQWKFTKNVSHDMIRVQTILDDMLELSRPTVLNAEPTNLNEIVLLAVNLCVNRADDQKVHVVQDFALKLPMAWSDKKRLYRCLTNLIQNSLQALPKAGGSLTLTTRLVPCGDPEKPEAVQIVITDTGSGIAPDVLPRIFTPFFTTKATGTGLGMLVVKKVVEDHRGTIEVTSTVGKGTTFTLTLPLRPVDSLPSLSVPRPAPPQAAPEVPAAERDSSNGQRAPLTPQKGIPQTSEKIA